MIRAHDYPTIHTLPKFMRRYQSKGEPMQFVCPECDMPGTKHCRNNRCLDCQKIAKAEIDRRYNIKHGRVDPANPVGRPKRKDPNYAARANEGFSELSQQFLNRRLI